jgi:hypothetical protein
MKMMRKTTSMHAQPSTTFSAWALLFLVGACLSVRAEEVTLVLESFPPATFPRVSRTIEVSSSTNQLEITEQAALFALSAEGWGLEGYGGQITYPEPPVWSGTEYAVQPIPGPSPTLSDLFGYELNSESLQYGSYYQLWFHTDEWVARLSHDIGESVNNYGVISGNMSGSWLQCAVTHWGRFFVLQPPVIVTDDGQMGMSAGVFGFNVDGPAGQVVVIQTSTDLWNWQPLQTNVLNSPPIHFSDPEASTYSARFYRAMVP